MSQTPRAKEIPSLRAKGVTPPALKREHPNVGLLRISNPTPQHHRLCVESISVHGTYHTPIYWLTLSLELWVQFWLYENELPSISRCSLSARVPSVTDPVSLTGPQTCCSLYLLVPLRVISEIPAAYWPFLSHTRNKVWTSIWGVVTARLDSNHQGREVDHGKEYPVLLRGDGPRQAPGTWHKLCLSP